MATGRGGGRQRQQRHDQQGHDVDDLDQRVDGGAGGVLVGVAHGVAGDGGLVCLAALAAVVAVLDVLLGVVPGAAAGAHADGHEQAGDDGAHQQAAQGRRPEQQAHHHRHHHGQQAGDDHLLDGRGGQHVDGLAVFGLGRAFHDALDVAELAPHLDHHRACGAAHGLHRHGTEEVGNQAPDEQADDDLGVAQVEGHGHAPAFERVGVVGKQHQRGQAGRADGITLGDGLGGVAHGIERVGDVAHAVGQFGHLGDAAGVVGDGAVGVQRHHDAGHAQHRGGGHGDAVQATQLVGGQDRAAHEQHRPGGGAHRDPQARDDVGAVAGGGGLGDVLHRLVLGAGVVLGDPHHGRGEHQAHHAGAEQAHLGAGAQGVIGHHHAGDEEEAHQRDHPRNGQALVERGHHVFHARRGLDRAAADDGGDDREAAQHQRVDHRRHRCTHHHHGTQRHGGDQGDGVGFEQVGRHAGAVTDVVAHVVGNHRRVAGVVLGDAGLDLAHQVGAHIGALGEDAAAQPREDRDQRRAEGQAEQRLEHLRQAAVGSEVAVADEEPEEQAHAQQAQAHHQHAGDGAALEGDIERRADAPRGGLRGAHIGAHRDVHADEAAGPREHRTDDKADCGGAVEEDADEHRQHHPNDGDRLVLSRQVGCRTLLNRTGDLLHAGVAGILSQDPAPLDKAVDHGREATGQCEIQCHAGGHHEWSLLPRWKAGVAVVMPTSVDHLASLGAGTPGTANSSYGMDCVIATRPPWCFPAD